MAIEYKRFIKDFLQANRLTAETIDGTEVEDIYKAFLESLPAGITISKRMFLKHIRDVITVDTKPGYKYIQPGEYKTITKFVKMEEAKTLIELGFTEHSDSQLAKFQLAGAIQVQIDKHNNGMMDIRTNGFQMTPEILDAIRLEAKKYEQEN